MARSYRYRIVDVFTRNPLEGNGLAVLPDATGIDDTTMQKIAREFNLAETSFVLPATRADCAKSLRIFTPAREVPFAGHPTVGTSFVLLDENSVPAGTQQFALEERVGPVSVRVDSESGLIWLTTPPIRYGRSYDRALCASVLGLGVDDLLEAAPQVVSAGNPTLFVPAKDKASVDRASVSLEGLRTLEGDDNLLLFIFTPTPEGAYSRMFAPEHGIVEDPATGSATGPLAAYMIRNNFVAGAAGTRFVSEQGAKMGRRSLLHVHIRGERGAEGIDVGGHTTPIASGTLSF